MTDLGVTRLLADLNN